MGRGRGQSSSRPKRSGGGAERHGTARPGEPRLEAGRSCDGRRAEAAQAGEPRVEAGRAVAGWAEAAQAGEQRAEAGRAAALAQPSPAEDGVADFRQSGRADGIAVRGVPGGRGRRGPCYQNECGREGPERDRG